MRQRVRGVAAVLLACGLAAGCGGADPSAEELAAVTYEPQPAEGWTVSTPQAHDLDPDAVADLYWRAAQLESIYGLIVVKDGELVAEDYWRSGARTRSDNIQSVTKSYVGALVGLAVEDGCLTSIDEPMMRYFPELADRVQDPRKDDITIRQLLQMRAGYPWEEASPEGVELLYGGFRPSDLLAVPLVRDPGTGWDYSNLSSHLLGVIVSRACGADLADVARELLFDPLGTPPGTWTTDWEGYRLGYTELFMSPLALARFGQMYLDGGEVDGQQVVPSAWISESWQPYTEEAWYYGVGDNFTRTAYGYQWWIIDAGPHTYYLAWGHGGQQIAILPEEELVVVLTADPLYGQSGDGPWGLEKANLNLVADFIAGLPAGGGRAGSEPQADQPRSA